jgi:WD40 repeat protein
VADESNRVLDLFLAALERSAPADRAAFLDDACADNPALRRRLDELLRAHDRPDPVLDRPAVEHLSGVGDTLSLDFLAASDAKGSLGRLGHYEVQEVVGRGGFGVVLRAFDEKLHRVAALKVLDPALAGNGSARQRFVREARAAAAVSHDNVIGIYAVEDAGPVPYIAMQFVEGKTLQQKLDGTGPLPLAETLRIGLQIAEGLAAAHRQGLIHRDIKPANILLENGVERVRITDFGLARAASDASLTRSGVVAGTPSYMSPEQAAGEKIDHRSDLFSLGSVLYALCAGHPPFRADSAVAVLRRVCDDEPRSLREVNPAVPGWLAALVARLQAKKPADRFASAAEVATLLSQHLARLQTGGTTTVPVGPAGIPPGGQATRTRRLRRAGVLVGAGVLVAGVLAGAWFLPSAWLGDETADRQPAGQPEAPGQPEPTRQPEPRPGPTPAVEQPAGRPDPLDDWHRAGIPLALRHPLADDATEAPPELVALVGDGRFLLPRKTITHWPVLTADGRLLALPCGTAVALYDAHTGALVRVLTGHTGRAFRGDFSADGRRFACGSEDGGIRVWDVATGKQEMAVTDPGEHVWTTVFAPDGKQLVTCGKGGKVRVWDTATRAVKPLGEHKGGARHLAFSPDGTRLASVGDDETLKVWDWKGGELVKEVLEGHREPVERVAFSPDGTWLASGSESRVLVWDAATLQLRHTLPTPGNSVLAFTPDGQTLVTAPHSPRTRRSFARWDVKMETCTATRKLPGSGGVVVGAVSPDGRTLFAMSCETGETRLGAFDADTGERRFPLQGHTGQVWGVAVSPDGRWLASGGEDGRAYLWDLSRPPSDVFVSPAQQLPEHASRVFSVTFSPDGRLLACADFNGVIRLWDVTERRELPELSDENGWPMVAFSPDGRTLAAGRKDGAVNRWDVTTGRPQEPLRLHAGSVGAVAFSPDGRWFASGGMDGKVQLVDRATDQRRHTFPGTAPVTGLAFSPDSRTLAATGETPGPSLRLCDLATRHERALTGHTAHVVGLAYHPSGTRVATRSYDGTVRVWETAPGTDGSRPFEVGPAGPVGGVAFTPSGRHFAVGLDNGTIALFATPPAAR